MFEKLYKVKASRQEGSTFCFDVELDAAHQIYGAHFPGNPITPGACQLEMLRQLASEASGKDLSVAEVRSIKYLNVIDPVKTPGIEVVFDLKEDDGRMKCSARIKNEDAVFTKAVMYLSFANAKPLNIQ